MADPALVFGSDLIRTIFGTFGVFLIPAILFLGGILGYLFLYALSRLRRDDWQGAD